jgi:hypothetical protein
VSESMFERSTLLLRIKVRVMRENEKRIKCLVSSTPLDGRSPQKLSWRQDLSSVASTTRSNLNITDFRLAGQDEDAVAAQLSCDLPIMSSFQAAG